MHDDDDKNIQEVSIVVVGDIGHSPRMCNHAFSFASHGIRVNLFGYLNSKPHEAIFKNENIRIHQMAPPPPILSARNPLLWTIMLPLKFLWIFTILLVKLLTTCNATQRCDKKNLMLLQNPPGIPTMLVCYLVAKQKNLLYMVDWHNYTHTMFASRWLSKISYLYERKAGRLADVNFCVTNAMRDDLRHHWGIKDVYVHYDRPPNFAFREYGKEEKDGFLIKFLSGKFDTSTRRQEYENSSDKPMILVSSTSWTPDEDFSLLLYALLQYDNVKTTKRTSLPQLLVIITGKGPEKEMYLKQIENIHWENVVILTAWLEAEEYPLLLSCAHVGVCLHTSTSGLDLPMKVVDMFGSKLPVLAKGYPALSELVEDGKNGIVFDSAEDLLNALLSIAIDFPENKLLEKLHKNVQNLESWEETWESNVWHTLHQYWTNER